MATSFPILTFHAVDDAADVIAYPPRLFQRGLASRHYDQRRINAGSPGQVK
jgi:hypothetical protein